MKQSDTAVRVPDWYALLLLKWQGLKSVLQYKMQIQ